MNTNDSNKGGRDVLTRAAKSNATFSAIMGDFGYKTKTTFYGDLTIAEAFGPKGVRETYDRVNNEWRHNVEYYTEFIMCLNHKIWEWYHKKDEEWAKLYDELWREADSWAAANYTGEDLQYYLRTTD